MSIDIIYLLYLVVYLVIGVGIYEVMEDTEVGRLAVVVAWPTLGVLGMGVIVLGSDKN